MIDITNKCSSCKEQIINDKGSIAFHCPNCGKTKMIRCSKCRQIVAKYKCAECGFIGPN